SHDWDTTVLAMRDLAQRLDGSLRRAAGSPARGSPEPTYRVAGFTLDEPIGQGAYGEVWRARELSPLETIRAVKLLRPSPFLQDESIATRFVREARALIGRNH